MMDEELRNSLLRLIRYKFAGYPNVTSHAEDIIHTAYVNLRSGNSYAPEKENYGYMSVMCIRLAYRVFMSQAVEFEQKIILTDEIALIDETDIVEELIRVDEAYAVLESIKVLREIERIVITQRYYGNFTFNEIAENNGLKLNTVLSHHRRALNKLRPQLTKMFDYGKEENYE
ncbi:MAG: sigma-70 family RNA polymerase sigma factor [Oscillospiraceae bacterium]|jgi:RNA polymerase sigma factor (sigma-70 family)|nr:sigma-70 family RNA polymerase sigma factor [Oscillospiraceae bacterium]